MRLIFNLLAAIVIAVSFAPVAFAEPSDQELIQQYDEMIDIWIADGFNGGALEVQSRIWLYRNKAIRGLGEGPMNELAKTHPELQNHITQLQQSGKFPDEVLSRDMSDDKLIHQYDEFFDILTSTNEDIPLLTKGWLILISGKLFVDSDYTQHHSELMKHIEQKLKQ